ncbi:hypothetical protein BDZ94DRAFT_1254000 [Collybia nuda]|uniref:Uncharacterized protein n=1 Tax=Collybia nuda TaxID=64659 RepID=A0A9P6CKN2_9AGAR|nr:hypothetical protein BDZ94DRAFT_1254000 [Collybia nuda]
MLYPDICLCFLSLRQYLHIEQRQETQIRSLVAQRQIVGFTISIIFLMLYTLRMTASRLKYFRPPCRILSARYRIHENLQSISLSRTYPDH